MSYVHCPVCCWLSLRENGGVLFFSYLSRLMFLLRVQLFSSDYGRTTNHQFTNKTVHFYFQRIKTKLERTHYALICLGYVQVIRTSRSIHLSTDALLHNQRFYHNALIICYSGLTLLLRLWLSIS